MRIEVDTKLDFSDVLLKPKRSTLTGRHDVELIREYKFPHSSYKYSGIPVVASNMDGVGTFSMARTLQKYKMFTVIKKHYTFEQWQEQISDGTKLDINHIAVSVGTNAIWDDTAEDYRLVKRLMERYPIPFICIDVANGYQQNFIDFVKRVRYDYPNKIIIAGNVITPEIVEELIISGADIVKCGIGSGSVCTTRVIAGVGYPQLSGIIECSDAAHGVGGLIISDGGCTTPGDVVKAFAGGADFVMLGGMLAAHMEGEYDFDTDFNGESFVKFYGMSSHEAVQRHGARKDGYKTTEGRVVMIPFRGGVETTVEDILGGLVSACAYVGARRLKDLSKCATFVRVYNTHNRVYEQYDIEKRF